MCNTHLQVSYTCALHGVNCLLHSAALPHQHRTLGQLWDLNRKEFSPIIYYKSPDTVPGKGEGFEIPPIYSLLFIHI